MKRLQEAIARKVRVSVVTNGVGATDEKLVYWRYSKYRLEMLQIGVRLYEVSPRLAHEVGLFGAFGLSLRRLHAKVAVIDRQRLFIGSMNFDPRSAWSDAESGLMVESPQLANQVADLLDDERQCRHLSPAPGRRRRDHRVGGRSATMAAMHAVTEEPDHNWALGD